MLSLLALAARLIPGPRTIDDSFITFRYASNILAGNGFAYNPGEHVLGTTTPLYTFLLTILGFTGGGPQAPFPEIAWILNSLADAVTVVLLVSLGRRLGSTLAGAGAALVWAVAPYSVTFAAGGLETSVYVLLLTATGLCHLQQRHRLAALLGALALLTRPDALILLGPLALDRLVQAWRLRRRPAAPGLRPLSWAEVLIFLLPVTAWIVFATAYFGGPLPHSIAAKSLAYRLPPEAALIRLLQHYATPFLDNLTLGSVGTGIGLVLYPFLFGIGALKALRSARRAWPLLAYPWLYFGAFAIANPLIFRWYLTPPLPFYILAILTGAEHLITGLAARLRAQRPATAPGFFAALPAALLVVLAPAVLNLRAWTLHPDHGLSRPAPEMAWYQLELLYRQAADVVRTEAARAGAAAAEPPLLAAGDVGVLGFFSGARILDTVGLNSPQSLAYYPLDPQYYVTNYAVPPDLILDYRPDYVVILEVYGREGLLKDERFQQAYRLLEKIETNIYGSDGMLIFAREGRS